MKLGGKKIAPQKDWGRGGGGTKAHFLNPPSRLLGCCVGTSGGGGGVGTGPAANHHRAICQKCSAEGGGSGTSEYAAQVA